jgi:transposase-like protein
MAERGLFVDHTSIWRWTQTYAPEPYRKLQGELKRKCGTWHIDETLVRIAGRWMYLFRAVDSSGYTVDFYSSETRDGSIANFGRGWMIRWIDANYAGAIHSKDVTTLAR